MTARRRWLILGGLLIATVAAAWKMEGDTVDPPAPAQADAPATTAAAARPAPAVRLDKLKPRDPGEPLRDPFAEGRETAPVAEAPGAAPRKRTPRVAEPPPQPFAFAGRFESDEGTALFLSEGDRNLVVREGDTIDGTYQVERIGPDSVTFIYLPLNQRQVIAISDPAQ